MKRTKLLTFVGLALLTIVTACKKDNHDDHDHNHADPKGKFFFEFDHVWGMNWAPFTLNTPLRHPMTGDTMTFTTLRYYISNIKLKKTDGTWYNEPESYYLVDAATEAGRTLEIKDIPAGDYTELRYTVGVDSTRNVSGAQTGALSPSNGMFWSWNTGYIMIKAEGTSPQSQNGTFSFHLGGFRSENNIVTERSTDFNGQILRISPNGTPKIHMYVNPARFRHTLGSLSNGATTVHMPGANAQTMALDFINWIRFDHMHN
ncbi:MAG: MbnP family protein [Flavobacteriales bacterium]